MTAKEEITRRLKKADYKKLAKDLYSKEFDQLRPSDYQELLKIADMSGTKYKRFYKLKNGVNIRNLTNAFVSKNYTPDYNVHASLTVIGIVKNDNSFTIRTEFYTSEEVLVDVQINGQDYKKKEHIQYRRSMVLEKEQDTDYLVVSIDPIGEGSKVYKKLDENLVNLTRLVPLDINANFDRLEIDKAVYDLIEADKLSPNRTIAQEQATKRIKSVYAKATDNIKDDDIYKSCKNNNLVLDNMKMKYDKESIEIYGKELLKISTRANKGTSDELTKSIISVL